MSRWTKFQRIMLLSLFLVFFISPRAYAHGFSGDGMIHSLIGWDHFITMLVIGVLGAKFGRKSIYPVSLCLFTMLAVGGLLGYHSVSMPFAEVIILISIIILGGLLALPKQNKRFVMVVTALVGLFGTVHGYVLGSEISNLSNSVTYIFVVLITILGLYVIGAVSCLLILEKKSGHKLLSKIGIGVVAVGILLLMI